MKVMLQSLTTTLLALACFAGVAHAQPVAAESVGWITSVTGKARFTLPPTAKDETLVVGQEVFNGMTVATEAGTSVRILFRGDNVLTISPNTRLTITQYLSSPQKTVSTFDLLWGRVRAAVNTKILAARGDRFEVRTKNAVAGVRGSLLGVEYDPKSNTTFAGCGQGECYFNVDGKIIPIPAGQILAMINNQIGPPAPLKDGQPGSYDPKKGDGEDDTFDYQGGGAAGGEKEDGWDQKSRPEFDLDPAQINGFFDESAPGAGGNNFGGCCGPNPGGGSTSGPGE